MRPPHQHRLFRAPLAIAVAIALVATAAGAAALVASRRDGGGAAAEGPLGANAKRFLDLTSARSAASAQAGKRSAGKTEAASGDEDKVPSGTDGDRTPQGWKIAPAGKSVDVLRFPLGITATADGSKVIVSSDSGSVQGLTTIDAASLAAVPAPAANLFMGTVVAPDGHTVFASGGNANRVFRFQLAGPTVVNQDPTEAEPFPLHAEWESHGGPNGPAGDGIKVPGYPGNAVLSESLMYVAGTLSEPSTKDDPCPTGQAACGRVTIVDTTANNGTGAVVGRAAAGRDVYGVAVDGARHLLYASNWADEADRGKGVGTVSVIDIANPASPKELTFVPVGHHPSAIQLSADGTRLFVANTNDDTVSVLDVGDGPPKVIATQSVMPFEGAPVGAHPDAFALSPGGDILFVALAGMNAVELLDGRTGRRTTGHPRYIPTGWYPSALTVTGTPEHYKLWAVNAKGHGPGLGANGTVFADGTNLGGSVNVVDLPGTPKEEEAWTDAVHENDQLDAKTVDACSKKNGVPVSEVLCPPDGAASPIKHVIYIVTENKTFDQYFGDLDTSKYDADPSWTLYGRNVTTNHHKMADQWSLDDRFFSDAEVSVTGHSWTSGAIATDHNEKTWPTDYEDGIRGDHGSGDPIRPESAGAAHTADDELQDPEGGYIFEAFKRQGAVPPTDAAPGKLSMAIYGERTAVESGNMDAYKAPGWKDGDLRYFDTCRANLFITGNAGGDPGSDQFGQVPSAPELGRPSSADCQGRTYSGANAAFTLAKWEKDMKDTGKDTMPSFIYMSLPVNHTMAANVGSPTPASMVADNDYAIGLITEALSKSPFWKNTVIMQTEDDTQAAGDHVSALRDYLLVAGPLAKKGPNHQWGSMPSLLRTIETIFKVPPIALTDRLAVPQHGAFLRTIPDDKDLDLTPYTAEKPPVPFALNGPGTPGAEASSKMDWSTVDRIDEATVNAILYAIGKGWPLVLPPSAPK